MAFTPRRLMRGASGGAADPDSTYQISRSLRFNSADSAYLNRTPASAGDRRTWTWSGWVKRANLATGSIQGLIEANDPSSTTVVAGIRLETDNTLKILDYSGGYTTQVQTTQVFRDVSAWYHIVVAYDTTQATSSNRVKVYVNGVQVTSFVTATYPTQNSQGYINNNGPHYLGACIFTSVIEFLDGYMTEVNFVNAQALTPSSFGETNAQTGVWQPKAYSGSYGTNGFYLNFSDNSNTTAATLGKDYSGNGNNWTPNNFSVTAGVTNDSFVDTPTPYGTDTGVGGEVRGNYCTLNPLDVAGAPTISEGNLKIVNTNANGVVRGTFGMTGNSGKWYFEITQQTAIGQQGQSPIVYGMATLQSKVSHTASELQKAAFYYTDYIGRYLLIYVNGATTLISVATAIAINEVLQFAYDSNTGKVWIGKSNVWSDSSGGTTGNPATGANPTYTFASVAEPMTPTFDHAGVDYTATLNCGQRPFVTTAPTGFKALCTRNLPVPTIGATSTTLADDYFGIATYTGNGTARSLSLGFQPDFTWIKNRNSTYSHLLVNSIRGGSNYISTNNTTVEQGGQSLITSWDSNGVNLGTWIAANENTLTFVAWNWKAGGTAVTNTSGTISSQVSASPTSGFSIVTYTGTGANATIGHGLGAVPSVIITKNLTQAGNYFAVYTSMVGNTKTLWLSSNDAAVTSSQYWNNTTPTSSVFSVGSAGPMNGSTHSMLAYCFAPIAGYSAFGSYTGNGSTDGPFVHTGFRPAYVMIKRSDSTDGGEWKIHDATRTPFNWTCNVLFAQASDAENTAEAQATYGVDMLSNGFKIRASHSSHNTSTASYIYMAFASNPFKYSLAR